MHDTLSLNWNIICSKSNQVYFLDRFLREGLSLRNILQSKNRAFVTHSIRYSCHYRDWQLEFYPFPELIQTPFGNDISSHHTFPDRRVAHPRLDDDQIRVHLKS